MGHGTKLDSDAAAGAGSAHGAAIVSPPSAPGERGDGGECIPGVPLDSPVQTPPPQTAVVTSPPSKRPLDFLIPTT